MESWWNCESYGDIAQAVSGQLWQASCGSGAGKKAFQGSNARHPSIAQRSLLLFSIPCFRFYQ